MTILQQIYLVYLEDESGCREVTGGTSNYPIRLKSSGLMATFSNVAFSNIEKGRIRLG